MKLYLAIALLYCAACTGSFILGLFLGAAASCGWD